MAKNKQKYRKYDDDDFEEFVSKKNTQKVRRNKRKQKDAQREVELMGTDDANI